MSSERRSRSRSKAAKEQASEDVAPEAVEPTEADEVSKADQAAEEEADAAALAAAQSSPEDDPVVAARKAQRRAELEAGRQAKLAQRQAKAEQQEARAGERAKRAAAREEREQRNEQLRAQRAAKIEALTKAKEARSAKAAADQAARRARAEEIEAARKRRPLTPEEEAEARAYAEAEAPVKPSVWKFQLQVIKALVLRDMGSRFGTRSRLSYIWALLNPILLMIGLILVFSLRARVAPPNLPLLVFVMTGYPIWFGFYGMWGELSRADDDPAMLMFPQVTVLDLIVARIVLETATSTVVFFVLVVGTILIGRVEVPHNPMGLMFAYWSCVWLGAAFGLTICAIRRFMPMFEEWIMPLRRMGIFISGVIFTATTLPGWMLPYFSWNPLFRAIEMARESWHAGYVSPLSDPSYVFLCAFGLTAVGIVAERLTRRYSGE